MIRAAIALAAALWGAMVTAQVTETPPRPLARPAPVATAAALRPRPRPERPDRIAAAVARRPVPPPGLAAPRLTDKPRLRPQERPDLAHGAATRAIMRAERNLFAFSPYAPRRSLRPGARPKAIVERAVAQRLARRRGQVCGDPAIQGQSIGAVAGRGACGIGNAVRVRSVAGVTLQPAATIDCRTASALKAWVAQGAKPAVGSAGGGISHLRVVSHYACRNRNNAAGGRLSEHAFGRAIDIAGIGLKSGREITVLTGWRTDRDGPALRAMWRAACGPFGTVLGPNANAAHRDHFHFDTARYRSGSYCR